MKYQELKQRLIFESGCLGAVLAVLAGGAYFLSDFSGDYEKEKQDLESKVSDIASTTTGLRTKYDKIRQNNSLYREIVRLQGEDGLTISQQIIRSRFNQFRDQYYLNNLHLNMAPVTEMTLSEYRRSGHVVVSSPVTFSFDGLSDEYAYELINAIQNDLPGTSAIDTLSLTREGPITEEALRNISKTGASPLIKADIKFSWFGIKPLENDSSNVPKTKEK